jgi:hypothetical protein
MSKRKGQRAQWCGSAEMAAVDENEQWPSGNYLLELWDTGPHQDPARKKTTDEQTDVQTLDRKRRTIENLQMANMLFKKPKNTTDEQTDICQICEAGTP